MAKINTLTVEGSKQKGYTVSALLDDGAVIEIAEGYEFMTIAASKELVAAANAQMDKLYSEIAELKADIEKQVEALTGAHEQIDALNVELSQAKLDLAAKPADVRVPMLHVEHQDIPTGRTVDNLAPLSALAAAPSIDEPLIPNLLDPDAPARPPGPGEMAAERGEYTGTAGYNPTGAGTAIVTVPGGTYTYDDRDQPQA